MNGALVLDTSGWLLALAGRSEFAAALEEAETAYVPALVLAEVDYHLRSRRKDMWRLLDQLGRAPYAVEAPTAADLSRAMEIDRKFAQLGLGLVDGTIVALAERLDIPRLLTADADFTVVRYGERWDRPMALVVPPRLDEAARSRRKRRRE